MTITLNGTTGITTPDLTSTDDITANSATVLTSASNIPAANITGSLPAVDGSALTGVGTSTDYGAVGTYVNCFISGNVTTDSTYAGSLLSRYLNGGLTVFNGPTGTSAQNYLTAGYTAQSLGLSGTWRALSTSNQGDPGSRALFVRIS